MWLRRAVRTVDHVEHDIPGKPPPSQRKFWRGWSHGGGLPHPQSLPTSMRLGSGGCRWQAASRTATESQRSHSHREPPACAQESHHGSGKGSQDAAGWAAGEPSPAASWSSDHSSCLHSLSLTAPMPRKSFAPYSTLKTPTHTSEPSTEVAPEVKLPWVPSSGAALLCPGPPQLRGSLRGMFGL